MRVLVVLIMLFCLWICTVPFSHTDTVTPANDGTAVAEGSSPPAATGSVLPVSWPSSRVQNSDAADALESLSTVRRSAEAAVQSLGRSLGHYVRGKYQQYKSSELVDQFEAALNQQAAAYGLGPSEARELAYRVEQVYISDAESGSNERDQVYFHDLPMVVKKIYSEMRLEKTQDGIVETYDFRGRIKARWEIKRGQPEGPVITYYPDGEIRFIDLYERGRRVQRKKFDAEGQLIFTQNYDYALPAPNNTAPAERADRKPAEDLLEPDQKKVSQEASPVLAPSGKENVSNPLAVEPQAS